MGGCSLIAGFLCMTLPETMHMPLDEVIAEPDEIEMGVKNKSDTSAEKGYDNKINVEPEEVGNGNLPEVKFEQIGQHDIVKRIEVKSRPGSAREVEGGEAGEDGSSAEQGRDNPTDATSDEQEPENVFTKF